MYFVFSLWNVVLSIKLIYIELLISHFIRPVDSAELPNVARASKSLEDPDLDKRLIDDGKVVSPTRRPITCSYDYLKVK
jgi:hypothetical protein